MTYPGWEYWILLACFIATWFSAMITQRSLHNTQKIAEELLKDNDRLIKEVAELRREKMERDNG